jgi:sodium/potassium/calcium exchanger 6
MSEALAGITFLAFANGAPDIITAVVAGSSSSDSTALIPFGSIYGAALFSMAFILAMVIQYSPGKLLILNKTETLVPLGFYLIGTIYLLFVSITYGKMNMLLAGIFCSLYLIYIIHVVYEERKKKKALSSEKTLLSAQSIDAEDLPI